MRLTNSLFFSIVYFLPYSNDTKGQGISQHVRTGLQNESLEGKKDKVLAALTGEQIAHINIQYKLAHGFSPAVPAMPQFVFFHISCVVRGVSWLRHVRTKRPKQQSRIKYYYLCEL